tara:strand:+ start:6601 stop:6711 length:111 start_codon:yes stop_codon:yes gene_type:complete
MILGIVGIFVLGFATGLYVCSQIERHVENQIDSDER